MIKVAILGAGGIADTHIEAYKNLSGRCKITAIADLYPDKAEEKNQKHDLNAAILNDPSALCDRDDVDAVSICLPPSTHAEVAIQLLNADKSVLCEKPMAPSLKDCDAMITAADNSKGILAIVAQNRWKTPIARLKKIIDSGVAGKVLHVQVDSHWFRGSSYYDLWWRGTWEKEGGGCTLNHAVHHIDMLQWILGMPCEVRSMMGNLSHDNAEVEDISMALLKFPNGTMGQITSSVIHHGEEQQIVFQCEKARLTFPWSVTANNSKENGFPVDNSELEKALNEQYEALPEVENEIHAGQIEDFISAIETGTDPSVTARQGRNTLELVMAIYRSAATDTTVKLPLQTDDPFYTVEGVQANVPHFYEKKKSIENFADGEIVVGSSSDQKKPK